jgi:hypothetical protein
VAHTDLNSRLFPTFYEAYPVSEPTMMKTIRCEIERNNTFQTPHLIKRPSPTSVQPSGRAEGVTVSTNLLTNRILRDGVPVVREEEEERVEFLREGDKLRG